MKRIFLTVLAIVPLLAGQALASQVTNVELRYDNGSTVARIVADGPIQFSHQTEVPKNGRPDRLIVDIISATHALAAKEFRGLPSCGISAIRTSQYAVTPERIVRVVFDLAQTPIYQITSDSRSVTVHFDNKGTVAFPAWSAEAPAPQATLAQVETEQPVKADAVPARLSVARQNQTIENDRVASLSGADEAASKPETRTAFDKFSDQSEAPRTTQPTPVPAVKPAPAESEGPTSTVAAAPTPRPKAAPASEKKSVDAKSDSLTKIAPESTPASTESAPTKTKPVSQPAPSPIPKDKAKTDLAGAPDTDKKGPQIAAVPGAAATYFPWLTPEIAKAHGVATPPPASAALTPTTTGAPDAADTMVAMEETSLPGDQPAPRPTARFRREAASVKIKGTMVAEFPERLVVEYAAEGRRDPFASLVDETRPYNDPIEKRVPNVEGLRLVGVIESYDGTSRALFEDNTGYSYMLESGDKVRNGYVLRVESEQVYFQIFEYGWSRTVALRMEY